MKIAINIISMAIGFYTGIWSLFFKSIITACAMYDAGTLTGTYISWTILKCFLALPVTWLVYAFVGIALFVIYYFIKGDV